MLRLVVFLAFLAAVVYAVFWMIDRRTQGPGRNPDGGRPAARGPLGPDDDEDFLRELERRRRHSKDGRTPDGHTQDGRPKDGQGTDGQGTDETGPTAGGTPPR